MTINRSGAPLFWRLWAKDGTGHEGKGGLEFLLLRRLV